MDIVKKLFWLGLLIAGLSACSDGLSPEDRVRQTIEQAEVAAEQRNLRELSTFIHEAYADRKGMNKQQLAALIQRYFFIHQNIHLFSKIDEMIFHSGNKVQVIMFVAMTGKVISDLNALTAQRARIYRFELQMVDEDGWMVQLASWQASTLKDMMQSLDTRVEKL